jgi:predicted transcriptional regulator
VLDHAPDLADLVVRGETAHALVHGAGMSQRETARLLGVDEKQVRNDLRVEVTPHLTEPLLAHADELAGLATTLLMEAHLNYLGGRLSV